MAYRGARARVPGGSQALKRVEAVEIVVEGRRARLIGQRIGYVFDFGDDWRVRLTVRERVGADAGDHPRPTRSQLGRQGCLGRVK